jgi:thiol:disulfide interchange protein
MKKHLSNRVCDFFCNLRVSLLLLLLALTLVSHASFLPLNEAIQVQYKPSTAEAMPQVHVQIAKGYGLSANALTLLDGKGKKMTFAVTRGKQIKHLGTMIYVKRLDIELSKQAKPAKLLFQACGLSGYCYPPSQRMLLPTGKMIPADFFLMAQLCALFFFLGLLLAFSPCLWPMLPVMAAVMQSAGEKANAWGIAFAYVCGISLFYAVSGWLFAKLGISAQVMLQGSFFQIVMACLLFALALLVMEVMPWRFSLGKLGQWSASMNLWGGLRYLHSLSAGAASSLLLSPCLTPAWMAALMIMTQLAQPALGAAALFCLGFGMGLPLMLLVGTGHRLSIKNNHWMLFSREITGFLMLCLACYYLGLALSWLLALMASLVLVCFLIRRWFCLQKVWQNHRPSALLSIILLAGFLMLSFWQWQKQAIDRGQQALPASISMQKDLAKALKSKGVLLLDLYADWCPSCQVLEADLKEASMAKMLTSMPRYRLDISSLSPSKRSFMKRYKIPAPPALLWFRLDHLGKPQLASSMLGYESKKSLKIFLMNIVDEHPKEKILGK